MATDRQKSGFSRRVTPPLTPEQVKAVNANIEVRLARQRKQHGAEIADLKRRHEAELTALREELAPSDDVVRHLKDEVTALTTANYAVRKSAAILAAAQQAADFVNIDEVRQLTERFVEYSEEHRDWVIRLPNKGIRLAASGRPMSLFQFYFLYANEKPYLVRKLQKA